MGQRRSIRHFSSPCSNFRYMIPIILDALYRKIKRTESFSLTAIFH
ncbi:hypothetical protein B8V81_4177 [Paenibacillus pasadenensis]|uniref:Uncharacterized protein n=1 Tax=Paenibacillus pasadenensis TaxID=217090 RepID=A0A2N5N5W3_9BACL|nr:hypothetical protein B8V81_4177 [Paenibacillus pasadenensis]